MVSGDLLMLQAMQLGLIVLAWSKAALVLGLAYGAWRIARRF